MKRVGYALILAVALLTIFTLALAQFGNHSAKHLYSVLSGRAEGSYFGSSVLKPAAYTPAGRWIAVSASGEKQGVTRTGRVLFYDSTLTNAPVLEIAAPWDGELFGWSLAGGGDWNGDGLADLAVGALGGEGAPGDPAGKVYLFMGGESFGSAAGAVLSVGEAGDQFGAAMELSADLNGDGLADLVVGAPHSARNGATSGRVYVWWGKRGGTPGAEPDAEIALGTTNDEFGSAVAAGDLTGDGQADLVIGARQRNMGTRIPGAVFVFRGGGNIDLSAATQVIAGEATSFQDLFGASVAVVQDVNGDGNGELLVGAPQVAEGEWQVGRAYLYHGGEEIASKPAVTLTGKVEAGRFGERVYGLNDMNGDGHSEYAVQGEQEDGARGVLHCYDGTTGQEFYAFAGENGTDRLGGAMATLDSTYGGGRHILVGARWNDASGENAGRVYVLRIE